MKEENEIKKLVDHIDDSKSMHFPLNFGLMSSNYRGGAPVVYANSAHYRANGFECGPHHSPISKVLKK